MCYWVLLMCRDTCDFDLYFECLWGINVLEFLSSEWITLDKELLSLVWLHEVSLWSKITFLEGPRMLPISSWLSLLNTSSCVCVHACVFSSLFMVPVSNWCYTIHILNYLISPQTVSSMKNGILICHFYILGLNHKL